eukprot:3652473-Pyramimonas_sp.AAC.1
MAGRAIGARPTPQAFKDTGGGNRRQRRYDGRTLTAPAAPTLPVEVVTHNPALRFPPGRRVFTD